jgi:hypothetical protein
MEDGKPRSEGLAVISYLIAAAILLPLGWWLKAAYAPAIADWSRSLFH